MQYRSAYADDYEYVKNLWLIAFNEDPEFLDKFFNERTSTDRITVCVENNEIASALHMLPYNIYVGKAVKASYIVGAATYQQYRYKGFMEGLLKFSTELMKRRGEALCVLKPFNHDFYRKYGWETIAKLYKYKNFDGKKLKFKPEIRLLYSDKDMKFKLWNFNSANFKYVDLNGGFGYEANNEFYSCIPLENAEFEEAVDYTMLRIIDFQALSGKLLFNPKLPRTIEVEDKYAPWNTGVYSIYNDDGFCIIEKVGGEAEQHFTITELTKLLFSDRSEIYEEY